MDLGLRCLPRVTAAGSEQRSSGFEVSVCFMWWLLVEGLLLSEPTLHERWSERVTCLENQGETVALQIREVSVNTTRLLRGFSEDLE